MGRIECVSVVPVLWLDTTEEVWCCQELEFTALATGEVLFENPAIIAKTLKELTVAETAESDLVRRLQLAGLLVGIYHETKLRCIAICPNTTSTSLKQDQADALGQIVFQLPSLLSQFERDDKMRVFH